MTTKMADLIGVDTNTGACWAKTVSGHQCRKSRIHGSAWCVVHGGTRANSFPEELTWALKAERLGVSVDTARRVSGTAREAELDEAWWGEQVYALMRGDEIKIGFTRNLMLRMQALGHTLNDVLCTIPGGRSLEWRLHQELSAYRVRGEWFEPVDAVLDALSRELQQANEDRAAGLLPQERQIA